MTACPVSPITLHPMTCPNSVRPGGGSFCAVAQWDGALPVTVTQPITPSSSGCCSQKLKEKDKESICIRTSSTTTGKYQYNSGGPLWLQSVFLSYFPQGFLLSSPPMTQTSPSLGAMYVLLPSPLSSTSFFSSSSSLQHLPDRPRLGTVVSPSSGRDVRSKRLLQFYKQNFPFVRMLPISLQSHFKETSLPKRPFWCCINQHPKSSCKFLIPHILFPFPLLLLQGGHRGKDETSQGAPAETRLDVTFCNCSYGRRYDQGECRGTGLCTLNCEYLARTKSLGRSRRTA